MSNSLSCLAIVVSGLAANTQNLLQHPHAAVLVVAQDAAPNGSYARRRISIDILARPNVQLRVRSMIPRLFKVGS